MHNDSIHMHIITDPYMVITKHDLSNRTEEDRTYKKGVSFSEINTVSPFLTSCSIHSMALGYMYTHIHTRKQIKPHNTVSAYCDTFLHFLSLRHQQSS